MASSSSKSTPRAHPSSNGLESAAREAVRDELDRRGVGGGGGGNDRLAALERDVAVIQQTMATREFLECELGKIRNEIAKMPLTLMRWGFGLIGAFGAVAGAVFAIMRMTGKAP